MKLLSTVASILLLLFSIIAGLLLVAPSSANFFPETTPPGIQITSGGIVKGTDKIQRNGNVYTFTGDIYGTIVVLRDDIVLDGAGYTLEGSGSGTGIFLQERDNVEIRNMRICNFGYGIKFTWLSYGSPAVPRSNVVSGITIANNTYGIAFYDFSEGNEISGNYFTGNTFGVSLFGSFYSSNNVFRNNRFNENKYSIMDESDKPNDMDTSNTVNGKPIYYWVDQHDKTVPSDAGYVVLKNCSGITVQGLSLDGNGDGVLLCYTNDSTVSGNIVANNLNGITLQGSSNNVISDNLVASNDEYGIYLDGVSRDNNISDNRIEENGKDGVSVYAIGSLKGNMVSQNQISNNQENGISVNGAQKCKIVGNNITLNTVCGIRLAYGASKNVVSGNYLSKNGLGILLFESLENAITENMMIENYGWAIRLNGSQRNNVIHHNNFINNNVEEGLQVSIPAAWTFGLEQGSPTLGAGNPNVWDDGKEGNYWSDYRSRYPNATKIDHTGIGDTPFYINENNMDHYPLMNPVSADLSLPEQQQEGEDFTEAKLPVDYTIPIVAVIAVVGILAASTYLILKRKKPTAKN